MDEGQSGASGLSVVQIREAGLHIRGEPYLLI